VLEYAPRPQQVAVEGTPSMGGSSADPSSTPQAALHYWAAARGAELSFHDLYAALEPYVDDPERRWNECLRVKRGLTDTAIPGSFCKDQCYLQGALAILVQRDHIDFRVLHCGRICLSDLHRVRKVARPAETLVPHFLRDIEAYHKLLERIAIVNDIPKDLELPYRESLVLGL
jgi:hypothetical protein